MILRWIRDFPDLVMEHVDLICNVGDQIVVHQLYDYLQNSTHSTHSNDIIERVKLQSRIQQYNNQIYITELTTKLMDYEMYKSLHKLVHFDTSIM